MGAIFDTQDKETVNRGGQRIMLMEIVSVFKLDRQYFRSSLRYLEPLPSLINPANALHIAMLVGEGMRGEGKYPLCYQFVLRAYAK